MNLTYVPTSVVVAVVVNGFIVGKFWFLAPLGSHGWYRPWAHCRDADCINKKIKKKNIKQGSVTLLYSEITKMIMI